MAIILSKNTKKHLNYTNVSLRENSCLEVTNFTHRGIESKDDVSAVGECCLSSDGWHCRCFLNCELNFVGWFWRKGGGR